MTDTTDPSDFIEQMPMAAPDETSKMSKTRLSSWPRLVKLLTHINNWRKTESEADRRLKWHHRRLRLAARGYGGLKEDLTDEVDDDASLRRRPPIRKKPSVFQYAKELFQSSSTSSASAIKDDQVDSSIILGTCPMSRLQKWI